MQIRHLRFANLNSLAGEWQVDLTHPAYVSDGIFAITGPTGAGKSTLLDAICLALYGRTPRLDRISQSGNEIMARHTGDCFAEVTFATAAGVFRCHWSQRRARGKPSGALQPPKHEIADARTGKILEHKIRAVAERVIAVTGMDFERFTRSMLLAQGGFAAFLQADADARAPILEQITGTDIYSRISIAVHQRQRAEQDKLKLLQAELQGVPLLTPEQEQELQQALAARQAELDQASQQQERLAAALAWRRKLAALEEDIAALADAQDKLQQETAAFQPEQTRLDHALRAATLDGPWASLIALRQQQDADARRLQAEQQALPGLEQALQEQRQRAQATSEQNRHLKDALKAAAPTWTRVRLLDQQLSAQADAVAKSKQQRAQRQQDVRARTKEQAAHARQLAHAQAEQQRIVQELGTNAADQWLVANLAAVQTRLEALQALQTASDRLSQSHRSATAKVEQAQTTLQQRAQTQAQQQQRKQQAAQAVQQTQDALTQLLAGKLLREYRNERDALQREVALLHKIASLESERQRLQEGQPCPLCGATHHPWATEQAPEPSAVEQQIAALDERIRQAEQQQQTLDQKKAALQAASDALTQADKKSDRADYDKQLASQHLQEIQASLTQTRNQLADAQQALTQQLTPLGITASDANNPSTLLPQLQQRLTHWQALQQEQKQTEENIAKLGADGERLTSLLATQQGTLTAAEQELAQQRQALQQLHEQRHQLYGDKDPQAEEQRLQHAQEQADAAERSANQEQARLAQNLAQAQTACTTLQAQIADRQPRLEQAEATFANARQAAGFADEPAFAEAQLPADERNALAHKAQQLAERQTQLKTRQQDRRQQLATERSKALSEQPLPELEAAHGAQQQALAQLHEALAALKQQLAASAQARQRAAQKQQQIEAQQKDCARWDDLHALIGSADGKKYRNFAQGLTFEIMVGHANRELQKMSDRYLLLRDAEQPLQLNVMDAWQAGEIRSTQNLSGGESFIVSLALALGLAQMASRNVRIDSLFLDEGFGTLDEQALDTALQALTTLQQDGKLIGIISHVAALKERIATQIRVAPRGNGRSELEGPGCGSG